jgi:hypothetical protein
MEAASVVAYHHPRQLSKMHEFILFPCNSIVDQCMYSHYDNQTLVTRDCSVRMKQAQSRMKELEYWGAPKKFVVVTHLSFWWVNLILLLMPLQTFSIRNRVKKRFDKERRLLEQELNDPVLRQALERKVQHLSEVERVRLFDDLERRVQNWDSSARATEFTIRWLRGFRYTILFFVLLHACFGFLFITWRVESIAQLLENMFLGVLLYTLSYTVRIQQAKESILGDNVVASRSTIEVQNTRFAYPHTLDPILRASNIALVLMGIDICKTIILLEYNNIA